MPPQTLRAFIAIEFSPTLRGRLKNVIASLSQATPPDAVSWVKADNIHLTLKFLGNIPQTRIASISAALKEAVAPFDPFSFSVSGIGCFPNFKRPRVLWAGIDPAGAKTLIELQARIENQVSPLGYPPEDRAFSPHVTLGRVRREARPEAAAKAGEAVRAQWQVELGTQRVNAVTLMKSELRPGGPVYTQLFIVALDHAAKG
ncbi:MAG: RNA 2',3'-cyclic phosphodiesterase [Chloroflexi bacterium]|nr:RNA 2',3'-cyclic phosphodiesterase [Chloroflexota bacterium]